MLCNVLVDNRARWLDKDSSPVFSLFHGVEILNIGQGGKEAK